jgi:uncharacterized membrane protein
METIEKIIEVNAPLSSVYNQWTQFESFPEFMEGVIEIKQLDDRRLHWKANIGGKVKEWDAEIIQQTPDSIIAWRTISGPAHEGTVTFRMRGPGRTEIMVRIEFQPQSMLESLAGTFGVVGRRIEGDLERFKEFIENRPSETGAWRGRIAGAQVDRPSEEPRSKRIRAS